MNDYQGLLIAIEGIEGSGKTTQARMLAENLQSAGHKFIQVKEPGSTPLGNHLQGYLKGKQPLCMEAEIMLFCAARVQLVKSFIIPALSRGIHVIADRWAHSTVAYQGAGRGGSMELINSLNQTACQGIQADLTVLLDLEPEAGLERIGNEQLALGASPGRADPAGQRRFEDQKLSFHRKVRKAYLKMAQEQPERWLMLPAAASAENIAATINEKAQQLLLRKSKQHEQ